MKIKERLICEIHPISVYVFLSILPDSVKAVEGVADDCCRFVLLKLILARDTSPSFGFLGDG